MDRFIFSALLFLIFVAATQTALAKMYRWTDKEGNIQYSDKIPSEAIERSHSTINKRGITTDTRGAARTDKEYAKELEMKRLQAEQQKELERQQAKDQVLLKTFRTEDDIILARNGKLATYDTQIRVVYDNIHRLKQRLENQQHRAALIERKGEQLDSKTLLGMENTRQEIKDNYESILRREHDKERIEKKYAADLARFRKLKEIKNSNLAHAEAGDNGGKANVLVETAVECIDDKQCDSIWEKALAYAKAHATTPVYADADRIFMTRPAITDKDISVTVSRILPDKKGRVVIFMDVQCKKLVAHETWCKKPEAKKIRAEFKQAVAQ